MLLNYLGKLKNQKFAILVHVKHVPNVNFYHLSNRCLPTVMKINAKINSMQNTNILLFVHSLSLTSWRNTSLSYGPISDRRLLTLQLTGRESVSRHVSVPMVGILKTFCEQTLANNWQQLAFFHVFLVQVAYIHCQIFSMLMVDRATLLNCKALSLLRTVNEQKVKCWYFAWC